MDFLDPKATRRHRIRLFIGYSLMAAVILTTSAILVFQAYGFDLDRKTGEVIQNGLVFVDSAPDEANVYFNDKLQKDKTNNRFALPSGQYDVKIQKDGYRDWQRNFSIEGGEVERFNYPLLWPNTLEPRELQTYETAPAFISQSPDHRWIVLSQGNSLTNFIEYDLNNLVSPEDKPQVRSFVLPANLFTPAQGNQSIELVEWSNDNKHFLIKHIFTGGTEFIIVARDQPASSININKVLNLDPTEVTLRDKKFDQWYLYDQAGGVLRSADLKSVSIPIATGVTSYKTHDSNTILYSIPASDPKKQTVILKQDGNLYTIREVTAGTVMLEIARYDGKWQVVVGSDADHKTYIYTDPVQVLQKKDGTLLLPKSILKATGPMTAVSFSRNTRFIATQSGQHFEVYDGEYSQVYRYNVPKAFDPGSKVTWIDGHRLSGQTENKAYIFDFDNSNPQPLINSLVGVPLLFNRDYTILYNLYKASGSEKISIYDTHLRLKGDR